MTDTVPGRARRRTGWTAGRLTVLSLSLSVALAAHAEANGLYRNGIGARQAALAGADVAWAEDALGAMASNPAGLGWLRTTSLQLSLTGVITDGEFTNPANADGRLSTSPGAVPDGAFAIRLGPVTLGLAVIPESLLVADWRYVDTPGGLGGVSYGGPQRHESSILVLRSAVGLGVDVTPTLSLGGSVGLIYNENRLKAPYVFQTQPTLKGAKTLLDLETDGFGVNGSVGVLYRPHPTVQLGVAYTSPTSLTTRGSASGNAGVQFAALGASSFRPDFRYDAEVETTFPQMVKAGVSWRPHPRWRVVLQVDWINWSDAFDDLPITLRNGSNADLNGFAGSSTLQDTPPLDWRDRFVYRVGVEYAVTPQITVRGGYAYGKSPVPDGTLTPLTAAIMEHSLGVGVGYRHRRFLVDFAYQYNLPAAQRVGQSELLSGEYSNSRVEVEVHWLALTAGIEF
jgi:long-subunit fatty acid transport protein